MAELRIGDADREEAVRGLGEAYAEGRLSKDEYDERSDRAWSARTQGDLAPLFADLPSRAPALPHPGEGRRVPVREPGGRRGGRPPAPVLALLAGLLVLGLLSALTHLPLLLVGLVAWFVLSRRHGVGRPPWAHGGCGGGRQRA